MSIILNHVNYIYDEDTAMAHAALVDVNLEIPKGQFIGLIGHTGSGKSTLIQHMNGLVKPTSGEVFFDTQVTELLLKETEPIGDMGNVEYQGPFYKVTGVKAGEKGVTLC